MVPYKKLSKVRKHVKENLSNKTDSLNNTIKVNRQLICENRTIIGKQLPPPEKKIVSTKLNNRSKHATVKPRSNGFQGTNIFFIINRIHLLEEN